MLLVVDHGPPAREALLDAVARLQTPDSLAPVSVAVPSPLAGLALRRAAASRGGFANVHFTAIARLAELLGAPRLAAAGRRPLTAAARIEAIHTVLTADDGPLRAVAAHPATAEALAATFDDLRLLDDAELTALAGAPEGRGATVVRLLRATRALTADCYDAEEVAHAAAEAVVADTGTASEVGHVVLYLPRAVDRGEEAFLRALAAAGRLTIIVGRTGDADVDGTQVDALTARLAAVAGGSPVTRAPGAAPGATRILSAPDPEDEVRAVARDIQERARHGTSLGRIAVLARLVDPYDRLVPEILEAADIPWTGATPRRLADTAAGRVLLGVLALSDDELARDEVAAWLASGPVLDPASGGRVNAARWDVLSRQAGVVRGAAQWSERLALHRDAIDSDLASRREEREADEWQLQRLLAARDEVVELEQFVADLATALEPPAAPTWHAHATWAKQLVSRYVGSEHRRARWPEAEIDAAQRVDGVIDELAALDAVGGSVDLARFRRALAAELGARAGRVGRFGTGVLVTSLAEGYAGDFDIVYVLGSVEGALPPRGREDPLLPDRDRRRIAGLPTHQTERLDERRDFLAALAAAPERMLTFPRADARAQRKRLPAQWVLESARALGTGDGGDLTAERLRDETTAPWLDVVDSFEGLVRRGEPASRTEYRLRSFGVWRDAGESPEAHPLARGALARGFTAVRARAFGSASEFTGFLDANPALAPGVDRPTSPTALQDWATCPFRYFLGRVLRLRDIPRPEATEAISALDEGALIHEILEEFVRGADLSEPSTRWTDADRARLEALVAARCDEAEARGITGRRVSWILARRRIAATARRFLAVDQHVRAHFGVIPAPGGLERAFGDDGEEPVAVALGDGRAVRFRGRIDRVDRSPTGDRAVVYDYKTGNPKRYESGNGDPVDSGRALQLPVYALAARSQERVTEAVACYWFTRAEVDDALLELPLEEAEDRFAEVVGTIVDGIAGGCFPAYPGDRAWDFVAGREAWAACRWCDFDRLCPADRGSAWERIESDPAAEPFLALDTAAEDTAGEERTR